MKQLHSFDELRQIKDTKVYALGTFDGIHRGHQRVIRKAVEEAASVYRRHLDFGRGLPSADTVPAAGPYRVQVP